MTIKEYFERYPGSFQCFQTADGLIFHQKGDAQLHAKGLEKKEVTTHSKELKPPKSTQQGPKNKKK